jgi:hypothetical protein
MTEKNREGGVVCVQCIAACERCLDALDRQADGFGVAILREILRACIRYCSQVVEEIELNSAYVAQVSPLCAVICRACMEECINHPGDVFARCADTCAKAAEVCRAMALRA